MMEEIEVQMKLQYADEQLDSAVISGNKGQAKFWLGKKRAFKEVLEQ